MRAAAALPLDFTAPPAAEPAQASAAAAACRAALRDCYARHLRASLLQLLLLAGLEQAAAQEWAPILAQLAEAAAAVLVPSAAGAGYPMDVREFLQARTADCGSNSRAALPPCCYVIFELLGASFPL